VAAISVLSGHTATILVSSVKQTRVRTVASLPKNAAALAVVTTAKTRQMRTAAPTAILALETSNLVLLLCSVQTCAQRHTNDVSPCITRAQRHVHEKTASQLYEYCSFEAGKCLARARAEPRLVAVRGASEAPRCLVDKLARESEST